MTGIACPRCGRECFLAVRRFQVSRAERKHVGWWCEGCVRFVPDERGRLWQSQRGLDLATLPPRGEGER